MVSNTLIIQCIACSALTSSAVQFNTLTLQGWMRGTKYTPKTVVVFTDGVPVPLDMHDRARWASIRPVSGRLWIMQFLRPDAVMLAGAAVLTIECFDFHWDFMCTVGRSCRLSVLCTCTAPKVCLRTNLGSRFSVCGFSSDVACWMLRPRFMTESIWQQIQMKTEDTTTKHAAFYHGHFETSRARTNVTRVSQM
jgi:hypothetical protein